MSLYHPYTKRDAEDDARKEIPDPHYAGEIAMLRSSLREDLWLLSPEAKANTEARIAHLMRIGVNFDGKRFNPP